MTKTIKERKMEMEEKECAGWVRRGILDVVGRCRGGLFPHEVMKIVCPLDKELFNEVLSELIAQGEVRRLFDRTLSLCD
jgi:hypothetical protein